jgi:hypothetical protein
MWENMILARQAAYDNTTRRMRMACWITKATSAHSAYVIFIAFPRQQWLRERNSILPYTYIARLVCVLFLAFLKPIGYLLYISPCLTLRNSSLPTEGIFVFCIDIRTVIMYLYFINWLVSMTETVFNERSAESLNMFKTVVFEELRTS